MQKPNFLILDEQFKLLKLKKKIVETELDMPLNSLSAMLSGKRNIPDKWLILLKKYIQSKGGSFKLNDDRDNPLINQARGRDECGVNKDEVKDVLSFDFGDDVFLNVEKYTKFPKNERPTNIGDRIDWDELKKVYDNAIREAWAIHKSKK